ncbi:hypothetical protein [Streptomyces sp. NPDC059861]|uniref:hypothetical protein n=1 Tax=Streptomyces sp. NPDC059861 TaxID=3346974 RepID=UPI003654F650
MTLHTLEGVSADRAYELLVRRVELVGGGRAVSFKHGLNVVHGNIMTGKTTFVRLLRALLGAVPSALPAETEHVTDIRAVLGLAGRDWVVNRPLVTTRTAPVDIAEASKSDDREPLAFRLPALGAKASYSRFLMDQLGIPAVEVPQARSKPTEGLTPVTMTDWLGYCVVTGDEIDAQVFGHQHPFRDQKRRWVFELAYGLYDSQVARWVAQLKSVTNQINALDRDEELQGKFLAGTPFSSRDGLLRREAELDEMLTGEASQARDIARRSVTELDVGRIRAELLEERARARELSEEIRRHQGQLTDLVDLLQQLKSQFSRLTRAVVSDEWLVDFDFVVCPRCGNDVSPTRSKDHSCYLCLQPPRPAVSRDSFLAEQDRISGQIQETESVIALRQQSLESLEAERVAVSRREQELSERLNASTEAFVSDSAVEMQEAAGRRAYLLSEKAKMADYVMLLDRFEQTVSSRQELEEKKAEIETAIEGREFSASDAEENIRALEGKMLEYLLRLNVPRFEDDLTVRINRKTYLPEISGRTFDELSSQGLKTLVNVAHSLSHHTVAIDRGLPLPGFLVLDGLSANAGRRGFDEERIHDMYRLLIDEAQEYSERLQIVAVDNDPPAEFDEELQGHYVLYLTQDDKLIRF